MEQNVVNFAVSALGSGIGLAIVGFLGREWISARLKASIASEQLIGTAAFEIKRAACLEALEVVDAFYANLNWQHERVSPGSVFPPAEQRLDVSKARACHNRLALVCNDDSVLRLYLRALALRPVGEPALLIETSQLNDLRNAMRQELGFGKSIELPNDLAWISTLLKS